MVTVPRTKYREGAAGVQTLELSVGMVITPQKGSSRCVDLRILHREGGNNGLSRCADLEM